MFSSFSLINFLQKGEILYFRQKSAISGTRKSFWSERGTFSTSGWTPSNRAFRQKLTPGGSTHYSAAQVAGDKRQMFSCSGNW